MAQTPKYIVVDVQGQDDGTNMETDIFTGMIDVYARLVLSTREGRKVSVVGVGLAIITEFSEKWELAEPKIRTNGFF